MAILTVTDAGKFYGGRRVFGGVSFRIQAGERVALVGANGCGKTTLLKAIAGLLELDEGRVDLAPGARVAYLAQDPELAPGRTVWEEAAAAQAHLREWEQQLRVLEAQMAALGGGPSVAGLLATYGDLLDRFQRAGGYEREARLRRVLAGVGLPEAVWHLPAQRLSGGQKVRLGLARVLLSAPDLLLLDEPTNHLDLAAVEWLEEYLKEVRATALLVSHDRTFLDTVAQRVLELREGKLYAYTGNYSAYLLASQARQEQLEAEWRQALAEKERLEAYIRKYKAGNRARQARDREHKLARLEERLAQMERPTRPAEWHLHFAIRHGTGHEVLEVAGLTKAYGGRVLFQDVNLKLIRGQRLALVGPNGAGKTTFLKVIQGLERPTAGHVRWGAGVRRGYFSQDLDQLRGLGTVLDEILSLPGMTVETARALLARFLFRGEAVERPVAALSGGEKNRLTLAKLVLSGANVLLLDEPTNHLDLPARQALEEALAAFPGTLIFVSHDRWFVDRLATHVLAFFGDGTVRLYTGGYSDFRAARERELAAAQAAARGADRGAGRPAAGPARSPAGVEAPATAADRARPGVDGAVPPGVPDPAWPAASAAAPSPPVPAGAAEDAARAALTGAAGAAAGGQRPASRRDQRRLQAELQRVEAAIQAAEARRADLAQQLADPQVYRGLRGRELAAEYAALEREIERLYVEWERLVLTLQP